MVIRLTGLAVELPSLCSYCPVNNELKARTKIEINGKKELCCMSCLSEKLNSGDWTIQPPHRKLSDEFVDKKLEQIHSTYEEAMRAMPMLPEAVINSAHYQQVRAVMENRGKLSYCGGFWMGYTIGLGVRK